MEANIHIKALMIVIGMFVFGGGVLALQFHPEDTTVDVEQVSQPNQITTSYEYNENNRLVGIHYSDGTSVRFSYDDKGHMIEERGTNESQQLVMN